MSCGRTVEQVATACGRSLEDTRRLLLELADQGVAVEMASGWQLTPKWADDLLLMMLFEAEPEREEAA